MQTGLDRQGRARPSLAAMILFAVGGVLAVGWLALVLPTLAFVAGARAAEATYVDSVAHVGGTHGGTFLYPRFSFRTPEGRTVTFTSSSGSTDQPFADGQKVEVLYDPRQPTRARRESFFDLWAAPLFLSPFVATPLLIATLLLLGRRRSQGAL